MKILNYDQFLNEERSIKDLNPRDEKPMVTGIAEIIRRVKDMQNRKEMVDASIADFKRDGIQFDFDEFKKLCEIE